jgi:sensor domain CHASE-containing protein
MTTTLQVAEQQEVKINIEKGKLEIQTNTKIHSMEQLVMTMDMEPSWGPYLDPHSK